MKHLNGMSRTIAHGMGALSLAAVGAAASELPPHEDLLGQSYVSAIQPWSNDQASIESIQVQGMPFDQALRVRTLQPQQHFYGVQTSVTLDKALAKGDLLLLQCMARGEAPANETGEAELQLFLQKNSPNYEKELSQHVNVGAAWTQLNFPFVMTRDRKAGEAALCLGAGFNRQTLEVADVRLLRFGEGVRKRDLPITPASYPGMDADAPWRAAAEARIETHRKGDLQVRVEDADGRPLPGVEVTVTMQRHAFQFASIISVQRLLSDDADGQQYREKVKELFNASGTENALKWPPWDGAWGDAWSREKTLKALALLQQNGLYVRGHVMVWPSWGNLPRAIQTLKDTDPQAVPEAVLAHIRDIAGATAGLVDEWDVLNEPRTNHDLMDAFGRDIMVDWFTCARRELPDKDLYINDFGILTGQGPGTPVHETYKDTIRFLLDKGAPVNGIGLQSHIGSTLRDPAQVYRTLDDFAAFGLKLKVTEFDIDIDDEVAQAKYTRDFMTIVFSHPAVAGFQMWGFWEGAHWKPNGAMFRRNWEAKSNAEAYKELVFNHWWTRARESTDATGSVTVRGFLGDYRIEASRAGKTVAATSSLSSDGTGVTLVLK